MVESFETVTYLPHMDLGFLVVVESIVKAYFIQISVLFQHVQAYLIRFARRGGGSPLNGLLLPMVFAPIPAAEKMARSP